MLTAMMQSKIKVNHEIDDLLKDMSSDGEVHGFIDHHQLVRTMENAVMVNPAAREIARNIIELGEKTFKKDWNNRDSVVFDWSKEREANIMRGYFEQLKETVSKTDDRSNNKRNKHPRKLISTDENFEAHIREVAKLLNVKPENSLVIREALKYIIKQNQQ